MDQDRHTPMYALIMGAAGGIVCFFGATVLKNKLGYDDSLDAFGVHGIGGTLGAILTGVFAVGAVNSGQAGLVDGTPGQLTNQLIATVVTWAIAAVGSFVLLKIVDVVCGLRVSESDEFDGLDLTQHGESGYNMEDAFSATFGGGGGATLVNSTQPASEGSSSTRAQTAHA
jgi:ammonium transporter, Amt family